MDQNRWKASITEIASFIPPLVVHFIYFMVNILALLQLREFFSFGQFAFIAGLPEKSSLWEEKKGAEERSAKKHKAAVKVLWKESNTIY